MTVSVDLVVMTCRPRLRQADGLAKELGARVVADPRPDLPPTGAGTWRGSRAAWLSVLYNGADYGLVLQDDVCACPSFGEIAGEMLAATAGRIVTFFTPERVVLDAFAAGASLAELPHLRWLQSQAVAMPRRAVAPFVAAADAMPALPDDVRLARWLRASGEHAVATVPSLVEHDPAVATIIAGKPPNAARRARLYVGDTGIDPAAIDWGGPIHRSAGRGGRLDRGLVPRRRRV
jgi:hypothetical protein